jgi:hypothetical protein
MLQRSTPSGRLNRLARGLVMLLLIGLGLVLDGRAALAAATIVVTSTGDSGPGTLRDAIALASSGDTIAFAIPSGDPGCGGSGCTVTLTSGELVIDKDLTIVGRDLSTLSAIVVKRSTSLDVPLFRILRVDASRTVTISGLTISGGILSGGGGGSGIANLGTLTLIGTEVSENRNLSPIDGVGGGIHNLGSLTVNNDRD